MKILFHYSGICDESGKSLATQIRAHRELGWRFVELRNVDGLQFTDLPEADFEKACAQLAEAGLQVSAFASGIANWACKISDPLEKSTDTLARAIVRMNRLGTRYIRVMSWPNDNWETTAWRDEAVRRMKILGRQAEQGGIVLAVENCDGWASQSADNYAWFFEAVGSPAVKAVFDTGNPASHGQRNTWEWYLKSKPHIAYVHIKAHTGPRDGGKGQHVWPDIGESSVAEVLTDLLRSGYDGLVSIEPHLQAIVHEGKAITQEEAAYATYVEYGRRLMKLAGNLADRL